METDQHDDTSYTPLDSQNAPADGPTKSGGNQLTTALIVIIVVLLFVMLMLSMNGQLFQSSDQNNSDITALESRHAQLRADANAERARQGLPPLPKDSRDARMMADRIQRDSTALATLTAQWQTELETKDTALQSLQSELQSRDENAKRLYAQIASLTSKLDQAAGASDQLLSLANNLKIANNQIENYRQQLAELQGRPSNEQLMLVRKQLSESIDSNGKLQMQVNGLLEAAKNKVDRSQYDEAMTELAKLRPQLNTLRYEIQKLRAELDRTRLFIESEKDLPAEAARLFAKLRTLEGVNDKQLQAAYENIRTTLGAKIIHRQEFATGSSQINFDREAIIKNTVSSSEDKNAFFLVVGYASKSGDSKLNRNLSAKRATTVASVVNILKATDQKVKAVYLGETARFSPTVRAANQICEVWEIKK